MVQRFDNSGLENRIVNVHMIPNSDQKHVYVAHASGDMYLWDLRKSEKGRNKNIDQYRGRERETGRQRERNRKTEREREREREKKDREDYHANDLVLAF